MKNLPLSVVFFFSTFFTLIISSPLKGNAEYPEHAKKTFKQLYQLNNADIDALIKDVSCSPSSLAEKISTYSRRALGTPYVRGCLGEGDLGKYDNDPLIDFSRVDCMTFCEQILALAISKNYQDAFHNLQKIRYQRGDVSFITRNHFVMADWLPHNQWLLRDVTEERGGALCKEMVKTIDRRVFTSSLGFNGIKNFPPPRQLRIKYLPQKHLPTLAVRLLGGEIMVLITEREGIFASHLGFIIKNEDGSLLFRHASLNHKKVIDEPFNQLCKRLHEDQHTAGSVLIEVRKDYAFPSTNTPR
ncbi:MAG: DUF1460 domain-containing protein [Deltaproteobacteria bacterium]|nr:DUF1460 domain-containing protein [Deltaproteobacteria bacterium]